MYLLHDKLFYLIFKISEDTCKYFKPNLKIVYNSKYYQH